LSEKSGESQKIKNSPKADETEESIKANSEKLEKLSLHVSSRKGKEPEEKNKKEYNNRSLLP